MTEKWTKGPWRSATVPTQVWINSPKAGKGADYHHRVATCDHWSDAGMGPNREEAIANARLIAAAPEIYDALVNAVASGLPDVVHTEARAALAKARGE